MHNRYNGNWRVICKRSTIQKANSTHLELPVDVTEASDELVDLLRVTCAACSCSLRAWFCCICSFSQFTRALCSARSSSKGFRLPGTARRNDRACVWRKFIPVLAWCLAVWSIWLKRLLQYTKHYFGDLVTMLITI